MEASPAATISVSFQTFKTFFQTEWYPLSLDDPSPWPFSEWSCPSSIACGWLELRLAEMIREPLKSPWTIASLFCFTILGIKRVMAVADLGEICVCYEQINGAVMNPNQSLRLPLVVTGLWQAWRPDKAYRKLEEARKGGRTWKVPRRSQGIDRIGRIGQRSRWLDSGAWVPRSTAPSGVECPGQRPWMEMETMRQLRQFSYDYYWLLKLLENESTWHVMNCNQETWL